MSVLCDLVGHRFIAYPARPDSTWYYKATIVKNITVIPAEPFCSRCGKRPDPVQSRDEEDEMVPSQP